jgi:hypothetical protein
MSRDPSQLGGPFCDFRPALDPADGGPGSGGAGIFRTISQRWSLTSTARRASQPSSERLVASSRGFPSEGYSSDRALTVREFHPALDGTGSSVISGSARDHPESLAAGALEVGADADLPA